MLAPAGPWNAIWLRTAREMQCWEQATHTKKGLPWEWRASVRMHVGAMGSRHHRHHNRRSLPEWAIPLRRGGAEQVWLPAVRRTAKAAAALRPPKGLLVPRSAPRHVLLAPHILAAVQGESSVTSPVWRSSARKWARRGTVFQQASSQPQMVPVAGMKPPEPQVGPLVALAAYFPADPFVGPPAACIRQLLPGFLLQKWLRVSAGQGGRGERGAGGKNNMSPEGHCNSEGIIV